MENPGIYVGASHSLQQLKWILQKTFEYVVHFCFSRLTISEKCRCKFGRGKVCIMLLE